MEKDTKAVSNYLAIKKELEKSIISKLDKIKRQVLTNTKGTMSQDIQILVSVNDELDDILLNWEMGLTDDLEDFDNFGDDD